MSVRYTATWYDVMQARQQDTNTTNRELPDGRNTLSPTPSLCMPAPVQGFAGPSRLILSFPVPAWRRDLPDRHGFYLMPCVLLQVCVCTATAVTAGKAGTLVSKWGSIVL